MEPPPEAQRLRWEFPEVEDIHLQLRGRTLSFVIILFFILVLSMLLFLYACWIRRSRQNIRLSSDGGSRRSQPPPSRGLGLAAINGIPVILVGHGSSVLKWTECCICLGGFEDGEKLKVLPRCGHAFHSECVDRWLRSESSCPLCRASLRAEPVSDLIKVVVTE